ncbi:malonyl-CoA synthase [Rhodobacterales bacterium 52_120_T64]|nr:malonyl-CoA synthase [Rhodobacterales bacterium 52_120_T64]
MCEDNYLVARLRSASAGREDDVFVKGQAGRTFGTFFANAERYAAVLASKGVAPGDRVAVQVNKSLAALELYVGAVMAGAVFLPLNPDYTASEITYFLQDATPRMFVVDPSYASEMQLAAKSGGVRHMMTLDAAGGGTLGDAVSQAPSGFTPVLRAADDLAAILYTSGTTGRSKGAMLTHRALASNAATLVDYWRFTPDDILIHALPIFHTHGLFVATNVALMSGATMVFLPNFNLGSIFAAMPNATAMMGVPTFYTRLLDDPRLTKDSTRNMRLFVSGSAPLLAETHTRWTERTGHKILERYGMTETNMNTSNPYEGSRKPGTVGLPLPGVEVRIVDGNRSTIGVEQIGSIEVRGENVFAGYWQMPEKTAEELREDGWFITGDLGVEDSEGYISIVGRSKDLIISGGFNVYPKEVEAIIDDLPEVLESAVIGLPHPDFGEAVVAIVVLVDPALTAQEISTATANKLARFKCPKSILFVDALPRNTMGKVQKKALREEYENLFR